MKSREDATQVPHPGESDQDPPRRYGLCTDCGRFGERCRRQYDLTRCSGCGEVDGGTCDRFEGDEEDPDPREDDDEFWQMSRRQGR